MSRPRLNLDGTWHFFLDPKQRLTRETLADEAPRAIQVPGPWQAQFDDLRGYSGVAWYRRVFDAGDGGWGLGDGAGLPTPITQPPSPTNNVQHICAIEEHATGMLNGQQLGEPQGG
jgi:hypothetical protein